jgi:hypothetical protein
VGSGVAGAGAGAAGAAGGATPCPRAPSPALSLSSAPSSCATASAAALPPTESDAALWEMARGWLAAPHWFAELQLAAAILPELSDAPLPAPHDALAGHGDAYEGMLSDAAVSGVADGILAQLHAAAPPPRSARASVAEAAAAGAPAAPAHDGAACSAFPAHRIAPIAPMAPPPASALAAVEAASIRLVRTLAAKGGKAHGQAHRAAAAEREGASSHAIPPFDEAEALRRRVPLAPPTAAAGGSGGGRAARVAVTPAGVAFVRPQRLPPAALPTARTTLPPLALVANAERGGEGGSDTAPAAAAFLALKKNGYALEGAAGGDAGGADAAGGAAAGAAATGALVAELPEPLLHVTPPAISRMTAWWELRRAARAAASVLPAAHDAASESAPAAAAPAPPPFPRTLVYDRYAGATAGVNSHVVAFQREDGALLASAVGDIAAAAAAATAVGPEGSLTVSPAHDAEEAKSAPLAPPTPAVLGMAHIAGSEGVAAGGASARRAGGGAALASRAARALDCPFDALPIADILSPTGAARGAARAAGAFVEAAPNVAGAAREDGSGNGSGDDDDEEEGAAADGAAASAVAVDAAPTGAASAAPRVRSVASSISGGKDELLGDAASASPADAGAHGGGVFAVAAAHASSATAVTRAPFVSGHALPSRTDAAAALTAAAAERASSLSAAPRAVPPLAFESRFECGNLGSALRVGPCE